jgi:ferredoxin
MFTLTNNKRPTHLGLYPLETLSRDENIISVETERAQQPSAAWKPSPKSLARAAARYKNIFSPLRQREPARQKAPVPDDLPRRSIDIKGCAYFLDTSHVGICSMPENAWYDGMKVSGHSHAIVMLVEFGRYPEDDNLSAQWLEGVEQEVVTVRAAEIAAITSGYIAQLGYSARAHWLGETDVDMDRLGVLAGLTTRDGVTPINPFVGRRFVLAVVTTDYAMAIDTPLKHIHRSVKGIGYFFGKKGVVSGLERWRRNRRRSDLGIFPMETVKRVEKPTTLIFDEEVPRIPQRALFYYRAELGDLGDKMIKERWRWSYKHPVAQGVLGILRAMVPHQDGEVAADIAPNTEDAEANSKAIKSLSYYLGSSVTGICKIPEYAWYSHRQDGSRTDPYNKFAVVMLIDQGQSTFDGASGHDWISGSQSMRSYMRGGEIAGVMATHIRQMGHAARPQTNVDSDVVQVPLTLLAGLTEQSRIGESALNPYLGPRFKTVILTTDLPLVVDKPIDFGLQKFCDSCLKCARECPVNAIPYGEKVMFNGYETWKPDSERCTRYRFMNDKGSACGRCIKTCPLNKNVTLDGPLLVQIGSWLGVHAMWLKPVMAPFAAWLDDKLGNGNPVPSKKWWLDLEIIDDVCYPARGVNYEKINPNRKINAKLQKIAVYPACTLPPPTELNPFIADRKSAYAMWNELEKPAEALARHERREPAPAHSKLQWSSEG